MNRNLQTIIACDSKYEKSRIVLFGAPYDSTTSFRPGTRFGPSAIRSESFGIETYSLYQNKDMTDYYFFDFGDLELPFGDVNLALDQIKKQTAAILNDGKIPYMIGGEHLVTLGAVQAVSEKYPDLHIIHFDAHADLRNEYLGVELSHATVMRRCHDLLGDGRIYQFGIRSGDREEFEWGKNHVSTCCFNFGDLPAVVKKLQGKPVYFTLDLDVLDPAVFPGTGTPEAGGVTFIELLEAIRQVSTCKIVGLDMAELSPIYDPSGRSTAVACKILREILLYLS